MYTLGTFQVRLEISYLRQEVVASSVAWSSFAELYLRFWNRFLFFDNVWKYVHICNKMVLTLRRNSFHIARDSIKRLCYYCMKAINTSHTDITTRKYLNLLKPLKGFFAVSSRRSQFTSKKSAARTSKLRSVAEHKSSSAALRLKSVLRLSFGFLLYGLNYVSCVS